MVRNWLNRWKDHSQCLLWTKLLSIIAFAFLSICFFQFLLCIIFGCIMCVLLYVICKEEESQNAKSKRGRKREREREKRDDDENDEENLGSVERKKQKAFFQAFGPVSCFLAPIGRNQINLTQTCSSKESNLSYIFPFFSYTNTYMHKTIYDYLSLPPSLALFFIIFFFLSLITFLRSSFFLSFSYLHTVLPNFPLFPWTTPLAS